ncbi:MAG: hypothetical protein LBJ08_10190 [Bifidobacteriaceae bacterium]|jgi:uncharacterized membrane protein|nr:hypothetical protein [Bifidobacteriaceae bacterium]
MKTGRMQAHRAYAIGVTLLVAALAIAFRWPWSLTWLVSGGCAFALVSFYLISWLIRRRRVAEMKEQEGGIG